MIKFCSHGVLAWSMILCFFLSAFSETPVQRHGKLTTKGPYLLNQHGKVVQLRGMSFYWSDPDWNGDQYYTTGTVDFLVDNWKCTVLRVAYGHQAGWNLCETVIKRAIEKGVYVIIDWHSHTAHQEESAAIDFFKKQAQTYKNTPNVLFEVFNEPIVGAGQDENDGSEANAIKTWTAIKPYLTRVTKAIRDQGAENVVILGTPFYAQHVGIASDNQVTDGDKPFTNVAYAFHFYAATHGPNAKAKKEGQGGMESYYLEKALGKVPVFVTEWGTTEYTGAGVIDETNTNWWFSEFINGAYHLSWCNWSVSDFETSSAFSGGGTNPSASGTIVKRLLSQLTIDEFPTKAQQGDPGPVDTVAKVPATVPAANFNRFYGITKSEKIPFLSRDDNDGRKITTCATVSATTNDNWISYKINATSASKYIILRCLADNGTGKIDLLLDGTSKGSVTVEKNSSWVYKKAVLDVSAGEHELKLDFTNLTGAGLRIIWFELTNDTNTVSISPVQSNFSISEMKIVQIGNKYLVRLPQLHQFDSYSLMNISGQVIASEKINPAFSEIIINDVPSGIQFVKLNGKTGSKVIKIINTNTRTR